MTGAAERLDIRVLFSEQAFVRNLARSLVADASTADDIVQQAWLRALQQTPATRIERPRAWLAKVVRSVARDWRRSEQRRARHEARGAREERLASPVDLLEVEEQRRQLIDAVMDVGEPYRSVLLQRYRAQWSTRQMAQEAGVTVAAIETRLRRAKAMLRERLQANGGDSRGQWALALVPLAIEPLGTSACGSAGLSVTTWKVTAMKKSVAACAAALGVVLIGLLTTTQFDSSGERPSPESGSLARTTAVPAESEDSGDSPVAARESVDLRALESESAGVAGVMPGLARVHGRLVRADGSAVSNTRIVLFSLEPQGSQPGLDVPDAATWSGFGIDRDESETDEAGLFVFERVAPGTRLALDFGDARGVDTFRAVDVIPGPSADVDLGTFVVHPGLAWTGRVVDADGEPVAGAKIRVLQGLGNALIRLPLDTFDPGGGLLHGYLLPSGDASVVGSAWADLLDGSRLAFDRSASTRDGVRGRVLFETPAWLDQLAMEFPSVDATTSADGRFELSGLSGERAWITVKARDRGSLSEPFRPAAERAGDLGDLVLDRGVAADFRVVDVHGTPVSGATVCIAPATSRFVFLSPKPTPAWRTTDRVGRVRAAGLPCVGQHREAVVAARRRVGEPWAFWFDDDLSALDELRWPETGSLRVRLASEDALAADQLQIVQGPVFGDALEAGLQPPIDLSRRCTTTAEGQLLVQDLVPGFYSVILNVVGRARVAVGVTVEAGGAPAEVELDPVPVASTEVRVLDAAGQAVPGALIQSSSAAAEPWQVRTVACLLADRGHGAVGSTKNPAEQWRVHGRTDAEGRLVLDGLLGRTTVTASHPIRGRAVGFMARVGRELVLRLDAPATLEGTVLPQAGDAPDRRWQVTLRPTRGAGSEPDLRRAAALQTPANARFLFPPLPAGRYEVLATPLAANAGSLAESRDGLGRVLAEAFPEHVRSLPERGRAPEPVIRQIVELEAGERRFVELDPLPASPFATGKPPSLRGVVRLDGRAVAAAELVAVQGSQRHTTESEADGSYRFDELGAGSWRIAVSTHGEQLAARSVELTMEAAEPRIDLEFASGMLMLALQAPPGSALSNPVLSMTSTNGSELPDFSLPGDGKLGIEVVEGDYRVSVRAEGLATAIPARVEVRAGQRVKLEVPLVETGAVHLDVRGAVGNGVRLRRQGDDGVVELEVREGMARSPDVPVGNYVIEAADGVTVTPSAVEVRAGVESRLVVQFDR